MAGSSTYPGTLDTFSAETTGNMGTDDSTGRKHDERHDDLEAAVMAVETELGTNPSGSVATVKARFDAIEANDWVTSARILAGAVTPVKMSGGYAAKTGTYTLTTSDRDIYISSGTFTITLYAASGNAGRVHRFINPGSGTVTLDGNASETIDGNTTVQIGRGGSLTILCDGSNWIVLSGDTGLRDVTSAVSAITNLTTSIATLRRVDKQVYLTFRGTSSATSGGGAWYTTPSGFQKFTTSNFGESFVGARVGGDGSNGLGNLSAAAGASAFRFDWSGWGGGSLAVRAQFHTPDSWPGSLPGTGL